MSFKYDTVRIENRLDPTSTGHIVTTSKGDIIVDNGTKTSTLSVGTNGHVIVANSSESTGIEWRALVAADVSDFDTEVSNNTDVNTNTSHRTSTNNPHSVTATQIGLGEVPNLKVNLTATTNPSVNDDGSDGYSIGSRWINTSSDKEYVCLDTAVGNAVWKETTESPSDSYLSRISGSTYGTIQEAHNITESAGWISGGSITDAGSQTVDVASGTGLIRDSDDPLATLYFFDWSSATGISIPTDAIRFIGLEYNGGSPQIVTKVSNMWTYNTDFPLGCIVNEDDTLYIFEDKHIANDINSNLIQRLHQTDQFSKNILSGGLVLSEIGTRNLALSAGSLWSKLTSITIDAIDTSVSDTFVSYHRNGSGGWTITSALTQWPNTQYDNGSGVLQNLTNGNYGVLWFYLDINGALLCVYGQNDYGSLGAATNSTEPTTLPVRVNSISTLLAKLVFQKSGSTAESIIELFESESVSNGITDHNDLNSIDGGTTGEYYHLTSTQHGYVIGLGSNALGVSDSQTVTNKTIDADNNTISNIADAEIKSGASIDVSKLADGSVSNTEFQYLDGVGSSVVGVDDTVTLTQKSLEDATTYFIDDGDNSKKMQFQLSGLTTSTTRVIDIPDADTTLVGTNVSQTLTNKTLDADNNTITNIADAAIKSGAAIDVSKLANGTISNTEFQYLNGITSAVVSINDVQTLTNKVLVDSSTTFVDQTDVTRAFKFEASNITTATTRTYTVPNESTTLVGTNATQTLTNKTMGNDLNFGNNKGVNCSDPTQDSDVATKAYVDSVASGLVVKESVVAATTVDLDSNSTIFDSIIYNNIGGASGRGQITATLATTNLFTVDGRNFTSSDNDARILIHKQTSADQNGIWTITISGTLLTIDRATDFDEDSEVTSGTFTFVSEGNTFANSGLVVTTPDPITVGGVSGSDITFATFSGAGQITAGTGMTKNGNILNVIGSATIIANADSLEVNSSATANQILLSSGTVGVATTFGALPLDNSNSVSGVLDIANGGTNASSFGAGDRLVATNSGNTALETTSLDPSTIVTLTGTQVLTNKTMTVDSTYLQDNTDNSKKIQFDLTNLTTSTTRTLTIPDASLTVVGIATTQTLTNKTINATNNTISNIGNDEIKSGATIDATKIANGSISNTEFQYLNGLTSSAVGLTDTATLTNKTFTDNVTWYSDNLDNTKKLQFQLANITTGTTRTLTIPDADTIIVGTDATQTLTSKIIDADNNTVSNIANDEIKSGATIDVTKLADGTVNNTEFQYLNGVGSTVVGKDDTIVLTNKTLTDDNTLFQDNADNSKKMKFNLTNISPATIRTLSVPNANTTIVGTDTTQTLSGKTIDATSNTLLNISNGQIKSSAAIDATKIADGSVSNTEFQRLDGVASAVVGVSDTQVLTNKTLTDSSTYFQDNTDNTKKMQFQLSSITASTTRIITIPDANMTLVGLTTTQTLTNKTINAANNTITNIGDDEIESAAGIDVSKLANGTVSNAEFQYLDGVTSAVVGKDDTVTLTNKTLASAQIQTGLLDTNGNELINVVATGSAVNEITVTNATTGNAPSISASGNDTNIDLALSGKGTGQIIIGVLTMPGSDGDANQVLKTDGSGNLSFGDVPVLTVDTVTTTNNSSTTISTLSTATDTVYLVETHIVARRTDASNEGGCFVIKSFFRNDSGTVTKIGEDKISASDSPWDADASISGTNILISVTGEAAKTVNWRASSRITQV